MGEKKGRQTGEREGQGGRKEGSAGRRHEKLEQELGALGRAKEMTVEIRTGAKRSEQKGTAGTKKFEAGRNYREKWTEKRKLSFNKKAQDSCATRRHALLWINKNYLSF